MAIYNGVTAINDFLKIAGDNDYCTICAKKLCAEKKIGAYEAQAELKGKIANKKAIFVRTSGVDQCICMDCVKAIHDEHIAEFAKANKEEN
jgi:hypothetical protein